jgi:hypothetical protein
MVWGTCRRLLGHHDAEDAFRATFVVLARKASSVAPREMVGSWLHGVARQGRPCRHAGPPPGAGRGKSRWPRCPTPPRLRQVTNGPTCAPSWMRN